MAKDKNIVYPVTKETMHEYARSIFEPLKRGECVTTIWAPMSGRSMWNKFIVENIELFKEELPNYDKYLFVYVEPLDLMEESVNGYLHLITRSIFEVAKKRTGFENNFSDEELEVLRKHGALYPELLGVLKSLLHKTSDEGLTTVLILGEFDELVFINKIFFNNLKSLWVSMYPNLLYIFPMVKSVTAPENIVIWDELREPILQNVVYVPLRKDVDIDYTIDFFAKRHNLTFPQNFRQVIYQICGGHPYMLKVAVRAYRNQGPFSDSEDFKKALMHSYELYSASKGIYNPRTDIERAVLKKIVRNKSIPESSEEVSVLNDLQKLGLILKDKAGNLVLFSEVFSDFVLQVITEEDNVGEPGLIDLDPNSGAVRFNNEPVDEYFTRQEYSILVLFLQKPVSIITRDDIGAVLWGEDSYQKYSDWAIDQLISKLRKKIKNIGSNAKVLTLRGRGYKFIQD